jgi:hypothetical protein
MALNTNSLFPGIFSNDTFIISLISEELKSRKLFNTLQQLGLENSCYQPQLDEVILQCLGLTDERNETMDFYCAVMDTHAEKIGTKRESVEAEARLVYEKLAGAASQCTKNRPRL